MAEGRKVAKESYLFREGDAPDAMFIVKSGALAITKTKGNSEVTLAEIGPGAMVGEMAIFDLKPRSANVRAIKDSEVIALPYDSLTSQMEQLPVWLKAIIKTLNENLREANKKIRTLETTKTDEDRFPPHVVNKYISILSLVSHKYGKPEGEFLSFSSNLLRNYTIQIFQEATNKMTTIVNALVGLGYLRSEERGDGTQKITNIQPKELFSFVDWYNEWIYKQERDRMPALKDDELRTLNGMVTFARKVPANPKGLHKVNLTDVQNESMKETGYVIRPEDINPLVEKKYISEKSMDDNGLFVMIDLPAIETYARNWTLVSALKKNLR